MVSRNPLLAAILTIALFGAFFSTVETVQATDRSVPSVQYPTIQSAIDAAANGDTIRVANGTYQENLLVNKEVSIIGANKYGTIIDGRGVGIVIEANAKNIYITGFTIRNGGGNYGVDIEYDGSAQPPITPDAKIIGNIIANNSIGVFISGSSNNRIVNNLILNSTSAGLNISQHPSSPTQNNNISRNTITDAVFAIRIQGGGSNFIIGNTILNRTTSYGIYLASSTSNTVSGNSISSSYRGIYLDKADSNNINHNIIRNSPDGINLGGSQANTVTYNSLSQNAYAMRLMVVVGAPPAHTIYYSNRNFVKNNNITGNDWGIDVNNVINNTFIGNWLQANKYGVYISFPTYTTTPNIFYYNDFRNNTIFQVYQPALETWSDGKGKGNHWSDYTGTDLNGDGIGDTNPWPADGYDTHPLMKPWSEHDIQILNTTLSTTSTYKGEIVTINVQVKNRGWAGTSETFTVTVKHNSTTIGTSQQTLTAGANKTIPFNWDTTNANPAQYVITSTAGPVTDELNILDNHFTAGTVRVKIGGDVDGNQLIDLYDISAISAHWYPGPPPGPLGYDPNADINGDGKIDITDIRIASANWATSETP